MLGPQRKTYFGLIIYNLIEMMKKQFVLPALVGLCAVIFFGACSKTVAPGGEGTAKVDLRLTDAPGPFEHVYLDIQGIEFHTDEAGWQTADVILPGVYDVLQLRNGVDSLIASTTLPTGTLSQLRVILGDENSFVIDGAEIPFSIPSGKQSGLKFNIHQELLPNGSYTVWTDFDVAKSIVETRSEEHTSELQSLMRISYAVFCLKQKKKIT